MSKVGSIKIDRDFPRRVTRASVVLAFVLFWFLFMLQLSDAALAYGLGAGLGIYSFEVFRMAGRVFLRTEKIQTEHPIPSWNKWVVGGLLVIKLPLWLFTIYAAVVDPNLDVLIFVAGIATPQGVMLSKVASKMLLSKSTSNGKGQSAGDASIQNTGEVTVT